MPTTPVGSKPKHVVIPLARAAEIRRRIALELGRAASERLIVKTGEKTARVACQTPDDEAAIRKLLTTRVLS